MVALSVMLLIFAGHRLTEVQGFAAEVALQLLSVVAGYEYGRRQFELRKRK